MSNLARFREAQDRPRVGFAAALAELEAGRKTGHWIWYVFPQLAGLGRSPIAVHYGLADTTEAADYLGDRVLADRLVAVAAAVRAHLTGGPGRTVPLDDLMGSDVDALKLISSMTLFGHVARALSSTDARPDLATLAEHAKEILAAAAAQGYGPCRYTADRLRAASR